MNIRKFIGATSRDALRLVREALGHDAVVLSNRSLEDGSVEIVALADRDLASLKPGAGQRPAAQGAAAAPAAPAVARMSAPAGGANPYSSGLPDVFSSVFGASPEAGTTAAADDASRDAAGRRAPRYAAADLHDDLEDDAQDDATELASLRAAAAPKHDAAARTMAESNPWLIEHARRLADKQRAQAAHSAPRGAMTASAAMARGLGMPVDVPAPAPEAAAPAMPASVASAPSIASLVAAHAPQQNAAAPAPAQMPIQHAAPAAPKAAATTALPGASEWTREAAQLAAARRAAPQAPAVPQPAANAANAARLAAEQTASAAAQVTEAVKARVEQLVNETVMSELASMREMMEEHFAGLMWADRQRRTPAHAAVTKHLFSQGFSAQLVKMMVDNLPDVNSFDAGIEWVKSVLATNLPVIDNEDELMERGGVFALTGPTGVGKTTTTAKLAARCVMRFGASKVALLTTDSYRIGGHEQLRIFGKILGVSVHAVKDAADLQLALAELRNKHIVLIDTIGMSQRDRQVSDQIAMLCGAGLPVQRLLLLNATTHGDTLNEVVQAYTGNGGQPLAGCILTKLDEATNLGSVLDTVIRYRLRVHYVSTGQKVPENLYVATKNFLIKSAFCIPRENSPFVPTEDDTPALLSALSSRATAETHEVRFG